MPDDEDAPKYVPIIPLRENRKGVPVLGQKGTFGFIGGAKDGDVEDVPLEWLRIRISGLLYHLTVVEEDTKDGPGFKYMLVHTSMVPKEMR